MITGKIRQIETMGLVDGPGIRVVIFMQGCPLRCMFCHNPEMWNKDGGQVYTPHQVLDIILKYKNYINNGGVTFSGGEPLFQSAFLLECLKLCKQYNIHTCIDTSGVGDSKYFKDILEHTDLVLYSIKGLDNYEYKKITGGSIKSSLEFLDACQLYHKKLWLRHVIIPNINDTEEYINSFKLYIKNIKNIEKVELLPYHTLGKSKYDDLKIKYDLKDTYDMDVMKCRDLENSLKEIINSNQ